MNKRALAASLAIAACAARTFPPSATAPRSAVDVSIAGFAFGSAELNVGVGDSVVWINRDVLPHTTTSDSSAWSSPELHPGERFVWVASRSGRFPYHCSAHPTMRGIVNVHQ